MSLVALPSMFRPLLACLTLALVATALDTRKAGAAPSTGARTPVMMNGRQVGEIVAVGRNAIEVRNNSGASLWFQYYAYPNSGGKPSFREAYVSRNNSVSYIGEQSGVRSFRVFHVGAKRLKR